MKGLPSFLALLVISTISVAGATGETPPASARTVPIARVIKIPFNSQSNDDEAGGSSLLRFGAARKTSRPKARTALTFSLMEVS